MRYAFEISSYGTIFLPSSKKIGTGFQQTLRLGLGNLNG
jgi:hypothetical protein